MSPGWSRWTEGEASGSPGALVWTTLGVLCAHSPLAPRGPFPTHSHPKLQNCWTLASLALQGGCGMGEANGNPTPHSCPLWRTPQLPQKAARLAVRGTSCRSFSGFPSKPQEVGGGGWREDPRPMTHALPTTPGACTTPCGPQRAPASHTGPFPGGTMLR